MDGKRERWTNRSRRTNARFVDVQQSEMRTEMGGWVAMLCDDLGTRSGWCDSREELLNCTGQERDVTLKCRSATKMVAKGGRNKQKNEDM
jgi:hypothetical protein